MQRYASLSFSYKFLSFTITESKRKFDNEDGTFSYEKHKIFLYKEDYSKFQNALEGVIRFVETGQMPVFEQDEVKSDDDFEKEFDLLMFNLSNEFTSSFNSFFSYDIWKV